MDILDVAVKVLFPVLTIVVSGACVLLFGGFTSLRVMNDEQEKRIKFLEAEREREGQERKDERERDQAQIAELMSRAEVLRTTVTGEVHLVAITDLLTHHHEQALHIWESFTEGFKQQEQRLITLLTAVESMDSNLEAVGLSLNRLIELLTEERAPRENN